MAAHLLWYSQSHRSPLSNLRLYNQRCPYKTCPFPHTDYTQLARRNQVTGSLRHLEALAIIADDECQRLITDIYRYINP